MISAINSLFIWLPPSMRLIAAGAVAIFFLLTILRLWAFIKDLIPFL